MTIARLHPEEWPLYKEIRLEALRKEPQAFGASLASAESHADEVWRSRLVTSQSSATNLLLFAKAEDQVLGMIGSYYDARDDTIDVISFYVTPQARGRGVGKALLEGLLEELAACDLRLTVNEDQAAAVALYRQAGFEVASYVEGQTPDGAARRELVMIRNAKGS